jgi:hypothetical protein
MNGEKRNFCQPKFAKIYGRHKSHINLPASLLPLSWRQKVKEILTITYSEMISFLLWIILVLWGCKQFSGILFICSYEGGLDGGIGIVPERTFLKSLFFEETRKSASDVMQLYFRSKLIFKHCVSYSNLSKQLDIGARPHVCGPISIGLNWVVSIWRRR